VEAEALIDTLPDTPPEAKAERVVDTLCHADAEALVDTLAETPVEGKPKAFGDSIPNVKAKP